MRTPRIVLALALFFMAPRAYATMAAPPLRVAERPAVATDAQRVASASRRDAIVRRRGTQAAPAPKKPAPTLARQVVKPATALPSFSESAPGRVTVTAGGDTFLLHSSGFDAVSGGCNPRGWTGEDRSSRVYAHVSDQYVVNRSFNGGRYASSLELPAPIAGTDIVGPGQLVSIPDSGAVLFSDESTTDVTRIVEVYPGQNVMREFALFPSNEFMGEMAWDPFTGGLVINRFDDAGARFYRIPAGGGVPVHVAGVGFFGFPGDTTAFFADLGLVTDVTVSHAGNVYFIDFAQDRIRMLRTDNRVVTLATIPSGLHMTLSADEQTLYVTTISPSSIYALDLNTLVATQVPGAAPADFQALDLGASHPDYITLSGGDLYLSMTTGSVTDPALIFKLSGGALTAFAGGVSPFGAAASASKGVSQALNIVWGLEPAPDGGIYTIQQNRNLILHATPAGDLDAAAGTPVPVLMGTRALWFGADMQSAPDEVANWIQPRGYGTGWSQRLTSPDFSYDDHPDASVSFDAYVHMNAGFALGNYDQTSFLALRGWGFGQWKLLTAVSSDPLFGAAQISGEGVVHAEFNLHGIELDHVTRLQVVVQTLRQMSNEDGQEQDDQPGAVILDNLRVYDPNGSDVLPPVDFENGTTGGWTLSALNGANGLDAGSSTTTIRDLPLPATDVALHSGFDFSDPSCSWTFLSPGGHLNEGTYARITSPWIGLVNPSDSVYVSFSGKLPTIDQRRVVAIAVRGKSGGARPAEFAYGQFAYNSGTRGTLDLSSPLLRNPVFNVPGDLANPGGWAPADSIQILFSVEDREEELNDASNNAPRGPTTLPFLDDLRVFQRSVDADLDGVPDALDACPAVSGAGRDADSDGCPDPTATMRHIETWQNASRPIHYAISLAGDPAITDGSDLTAIRNAVAAWQAAPGADVPMVEDAPTPLKNADLGDGVNLITFEDDLTFPPDVIAVTPTTSFTDRSAFDDRIVLPGQIVDSDLIFNPTVVYRTPTTGNPPESVDLQSVATHEIGHMLGLSHSGLEEATMFPVLQSGDSAATLADDDQAAIAAAYPGVTFATMFGTIAGTVARGSNGQPVPGALVTAWRLDGGNAPLNAVSSDYSDETGAFALRGLAGGLSYGVRVEPLDGSVPGLVPEAINARVRAIAQTNFAAEWWSTPENGTEDPQLKSPIAVAPGGTASIQLVTPKDVTAPTIEQVLPADSATDVAIDGRVLINFSEPIDPATLSAAFALRKTGQSGRLGGSAQFLNTNRSFIFTPTDPLDFGTSYEIELDTDLTDREGVHLATASITHFQTLATPSVAIFDVQPRRGPPGTLITIRGQGFDPSNTRLEFPLSSGPLLTYLDNVTPTTALALVDGDQVSGPIRLRAYGVYSNPFNFAVIPPNTDLPVSSGAPVPLSFAPTDVAVSPEGANVFAVGQQGFSTVNLSAARPHYREQDFQPLAGCAHLALAPDGGRAYVTRPDFNDLVEMVADTTSAGFGHAYVTIPLPGPPDGVLIPADGDNAYVSEAQGSRVWVVDVNPTHAQYRQIVREIQIPGATLTGGLAFSAFVSPALVAHDRTESAPPPRVHSYNTATLALTSAQGTIHYGLDDSTSQIFDPRPTEAAIVRSLDGSQFFTAGSGVNQATLVIDCLENCGVALQTLLGGRIRDVALAADGSVMAVNSLFAQIQVLDPSGGALRGVLRTGRNPVALGRSADGATLAVANAGDHTIGLYGSHVSLDVLRAAPPVVMPGDRVTIDLDIADPNVTIEIGGTSFASDSGGDGDPVGFTIPPLSQQRTEVTVVTPQGRSSAMPLTIVDPIASFTPRYTGFSMAAQGLDPCPTTPNRYGALAVTPDGSYLMALRHNTLCGYAIEAFQLSDQAGEPLLTKIKDQYVSPGNSFPSDAAFSHDGKLLFVANGQDGLARHDSDPASPTFGTWTDGGGVGLGFVRSVAMDPVRDVVAVGHSGLALFNVEFLHFDGTAASFAPLLLDDIYALAYSPDGRTLVAGSKGKAYFIQPSPLALIPQASPSHGSTNLVQSVAVTADGKRAVGVFNSSEIAVWSLESATLGDELYFGNPFPVGAAISKLVPAPNGYGVIAASKIRPSLFHLDVRAATPVVTEGPVGSRSFTLARTPDGRHLFASTNNQESADTLHVYTLSEGTALSLVSGGDQEALVDEALPLPVRVHLADANGRPQYGAVVRFTLTDASQGALSGPLPLVETRYTDVNGDAEIRWTMPSNPSEVELAVDAPGLPIAPLTVHATASQSPSTAVPEIVAFGPPDGTVGIAAGSEVFVRFSQSMDSTSAVARFRLRVSLSPVPGTYRLDDGGRVVYFRPAEPLPYLADCRLEVDAGALDVDGQSLEQGATAAFTVQDEPALVIASLSPPAGAPGAAVTINGSGFGSVPAQNNVTFNGTLASVLSASTRSLVVRVPALATSGEVQVQVGAVTSSGAAFVVILPDSAGGAVADTLPAPSGPLALVLSPDGTRMYVTSPRTNTVGAIEIKTARELAVIPVGANPRAIAILPDGSRAYTANYDGGDLTIIGTAPESTATYNRVIGAIKVGSKPVAIAVIRKGPQVLVVNEGDSTARIIDAQRGNSTFDQVIKNVPLPGNGGNVTIAPDGTRAYIMTAAGLSILDLSSFVIKNVPLPGNGGNVTIAPDGGLLFVVRGDHLYVISVEVGNEYRVIKNVPLPGNGGNVTIAPDGTRLYIGLPDQNAVVVYLIEKGTSGGNGTTTVPGPAVTLRLLSTDPVGDSPAGMAADPLGHFVVVANEGSNDVSLIVSSSAAPLVTVQYPNGGETLIPFNASTLTWSTDAVPAGQTADLSISRDLGQTWDKIASGIPNTGSFEWMVTPPSIVVNHGPGFKALFRVTVHGVFGATGEDASDAPFAIFDEASPALLAQFTAEPKGAGIELRWRLVDAARFTVVNVERAESATGPWSAIAAEQRPDGDVTVATDASVTGGRTYFYRLVATDGGRTIVLGALGGTMAPVLEFALKPIAPNPARGVVTVEFAVARETHVRLSVIDVAGRRVAMLVDGVSKPGLYSVRWTGEGNAGHAPAGLYFVRYEAAGRAFVHRVAYMR